MEAWLWGCLIAGVGFAIVTLLLGELLEGWSELGSGSIWAFAQPVSWISMLTAFGGGGILLGRWTAWPPWLTLLAALAFACLLGAGVHWGYVRPMRRSENSTGFSMNELVGRIGMVTVPIPAGGCGEVLIKSGVSYTNQIAAGLEGEAIGGGLRVVVVRIHEHVLLVSQLEERLYL